MKNLHSAAQPMADAFLCYDEVKFPEYIPFIHPGCKFHFTKHKHGAFYHGVVLDEVTGHLTAALRGTDSDDWIGNIVAWVTNFRACTGANGIHNGFEGVAEDFIKEYDPYFAGASSVSIRGHSQGGGTGKPVGLFALERYKNIKVADFIVFGDPPSGDERFFDRCKPYFENGRLYGTRYMTPGDPVGSKMFRDAKSVLLDGEDIGATMMLPNTLGPHAHGPAGVLAHSPHIYIDAFIWREIQKTEFDPPMPLDTEYLRSLSWIKWRLVN